MYGTGPCSADQPTRAELRRRKLIETARKLFIERGFHATGVAQIARESGIAVGQMYRDFASKEDIVAALVQEDCARFLSAEALSKAISDGDSQQTLAWLLDLIAPKEEIESTRLFAEIVAESARNERIAAIFTAIQEELRTNILSALVQLAPGPQAEEQRGRLADLILTLSLGFLYHQLLAPNLDVHSLVGSLRDVIRERTTSLIAG